MAKSKTEAGNAQMPGFSDTLQLTPKIEKPHYAGHRDRLKQRFRETPDALAAKALLTRFGSIAEVLAAPEKLIAEVPGAGPTVAHELKLVEAVAKRSARSTVMEREVLGSWNQVIEYCTTAMAYETREQFRILFLDKKNKMIADEVQQTGTVDHTPVYPREVVKRALELSATAIILVHNHPSGDPTPSRADIDMTRQLVNAAKALNITVHDHVIVGKHGHASFRGLGLI